ncbi:MAG: hypothetical protein JSW07_15520 [bacterium]|nr:MAG: hypothetical protein JSW07_15520 [bacterium]
MSKQNEKIYESPASAPEDRFWLKQGRRMVAESLRTVRAAANALITALGVIEGFYLGILGFAKFIPETWTLYQKALFIIPILTWLISLYCCIQVVMTRKLEIFLHSPDNIKEISTQLVLEKQRQLEWGFWLLAIGLILAFVLFIVRFEMYTELK